MFIFYFLYKRLHLWNIIQVTTWVGEWEYIGYNAIFVGWALGGDTIWNLMRNNIKGLTLKKLLI